MTENAKSEAAASNEKKEKDELEQTVQNAFDLIASTKLKERVEQINRGDQFWETASTFQYLSAYLAMRSMQRQERLMNDMHQQSEKMRNLTVRMLVMTVVIIVLSLVQVLTLIVKAG